MVCARVAFHENDGNHEKDKTNDEHNSDSYKQGAECSIGGSHENHENGENHGNPGCKARVPQTMGLEMPFGILFCSSSKSAWFPSVFESSKNFSDVTSQHGILVTQNPPPLSHYSRRTRPNLRPTPRVGPPLGVFQFV